MIEVLLEGKWEREHFKTLVDFLNIPPEKLKNEFTIMLKQEITIIDFIYSRILTPWIIDFLSKKGDKKIILLSDGTKIDTEFVLDFSKKTTILQYVNHSKYPLLNSILFNLINTEVEDVIGRCQCCKNLFYRTRANMIFCGKKCSKKNFNEKSRRY